MFMQDEDVLYIAILEARSPFLLTMKISVVIFLRFVFLYLLILVCGILMLCQGLGLP